MVNTGFGEMPVVMTTGYGRFAQPAFRGVVSLSNGYDNNLFLVPDKTPKGQKALDQKDSFVTRASAVGTMQMSNDRTALILDATIGALYYWGEPKPSAGADSKTGDVIGGLDFAFSHRVSPRMRLSSSMDVVYQTGADVTRRYTPIDGGETSSYFNGNIRTDLEYIWRPRLSSNHFYSLAGTYFEDSSDKERNIFSHVVGSSLNYQLTPKTSVLGEYRYEFYMPELQSEESRSQYVLAGITHSFTSRIFLTLRVGEQFRSFVHEGGDKNAPHLEGTLSYVYGNNSQVSWTNWYGLEGATTYASEEYVYRTGLRVNHVLTPRVSVIGGLDYNHRKVDESNDPSLDGITRQTINFSLGLQYVVSRPLRLGLTYSRTQLVSSDEYEEYSGDRFYFDATYAF